MKKQILFLMMAILASVTVSWSQTLDPIPLSSDCTDLNDALNPVAGNPYNYEVTVPAPAGDKTFHWFVTQEDVFITPGGDLQTVREELATTNLIAEASGHYNSPTLLDATNGVDSISITWESFSLATDQYVFVVVYVENVDDCTTNNLKVFRIEPQHAFTLDIGIVDFETASIHDTINDGSFEICVDDVQSAVFDPDYGDNGGVVYDFGSDTLYYAVAAANFSNGYQLSANFDGLQTATPDGNQGQEATIYWSATMDGFAADSSVALPNGETTLGVIPGSAGQDGQMLYLMVVIDHNHFEAAANAERYLYDLAIDGVLVDNTMTPLAAADFGDLHYEDCLVDGFDNDYAYQYLKARPTIEEVEPEFLPIAPE